MASTFINKCSLNKHVMNKEVDVVHIYSDIREELPVSAFFLSALRSTRVEET